MHVSIYEFIKILYIQSRYAHLNPNAQIQDHGCAYFLYDVYMLLALPRGEILFSDNRFNGDCVVNIEGCAICFEVCSSYVTVSVRLSPATDSD